MTVVNLGALASTSPALTGRGQRRQGAAELTQVMDNTWPPQTLHDGGAGLGKLFMEIAVTPQQRGWWVVHAQTMWMQVDPVWCSFEVGLQLNRNDLNGRSLFKTQNSQHSAEGWQSISLDGIFALEESTAYQCAIQWLYSSGYQQQYHCHPYYHFIEGEFIGEGAL